MTRQTKNLVISLAQIMVYFLTTVPIRTLVRAKYQIPHNINELGSGSLLIANHRSKMDPFVVLAHLPPLTFIKLLPIRFPVHSDFMNQPLYKYTLPFIGAYNIGTTAWEKMLGLMRTKKYLDDGTSVFIFPEGKINRESVGDFEKGIEYFVAGNRKILVVRIDGLERSVGAFLRDGNRISFSEVFVLDTDQINAGTLKTVIDAL